MTTITEDAFVSPPLLPSKTGAVPQLAKRKFVGKDKTEYEFDFLVIDSPEKWEPASSIKGHFDMPLLGRDKVMRFPLQGVSLQQWEGIEIEHKIPQWNQQVDGPETEDYKQRREFAITCKRAHVIELSSGKSIPGADYAAKASTLQAMNGGEVVALYLYISNVICSMDNGNLYGQYLKVAGEAAEQSSDRVVTFDDFETWQKATETPYIFRMQRPTEDHILEFPLKNISSEVKMAIDADTREPEPPKVPARDPNTKKFLPNQLVPDYNDESWLRRVRAVHQKRTVMFFTACLPFEIPGSNEKDKYDWLSQRVVGDVVRLRNFIEEELCEYHSRYNVFMNA